MWNRIACWPARRNAVLVWTARLLLTQELSYQDALRRFRLLCVRGVSQYVFSIPNAPSRLPSSVSVSSCLPVLLHLELERELSHYRLSFLLHHEHVETPHTHTHTHTYSIYKHRLIHGSLWTIITQSPAAWSGIHLRHCDSDVCVRVRQRTFLLDHLFKPLGSLMWGVISSKTTFSSLELPHEKLTTEWVTISSTLCVWVCVCVCVCVCMYVCACAPSLIVVLPIDNLAAGVKCWLCVPIDKRKWCLLSALLLLRINWLCVCVLPHQSFYYIQV